MTTTRRQAVGKDARTALEDLQRLEKERHLSKEERERKKREAERVRGRYDIPRAVKEGIEEIANTLGLSASAVAGAFLADSLRRYRDGESTLQTLKKVPSPSPLYDFKVEESEILKVLHGKRPL